MQTFSSAGDRNLLLGNFFAQIIKVLIEKWREVVQHIVFILLVLILIIALVVGKNEWNT